LAFAATTSALALSAAALSLASFPSLAALSAASLAFLASLVASLYYSAASPEDAGTVLAYFYASNDGLYPLTTRSLLASGIGSPASIEDLCTVSLMCSSVTSGPATESIFYNESW